MNLFVYLRYARCRLKPVLWLRSSVSICVYLWLLLVFSTHVSANQAVITTTDFMSGSLSSLHLETFVATRDHLTLHADAVVRAYRDKVYVINRLGRDNVIVLNSRDLKTPLTQYSTGNGSNPQDMAYISERKAYISRYGHAQLLIANPVTGDSLGAVDLSAFADADGLPEMSQLALYNNRLFAACQRLDRDQGFVPTDASVIAVIDVMTDQVVDVDVNTAGVQGIVMAGKNPADAVQRNDKWILSAVDAFTDLTDGGIEVIDLANLRSDGIVIDETALGGNPGSLAMVSHNGGYVVVSDENFANAVKRFDLATQSVSSGLGGLSGGFIPDLGGFRERLYVLDQGSFSDPISGVKVFDVNTARLIAGPISTGLPPLSIAFVGSVADFDGDCVVSFGDFVAFAAAFGKTTRDGDFDAKFDLNGNGAVDFPDFLIFVSAFEGG